eukprot:956061-Prorocentrum_minimum.AAC.1
MPPLAVDLGALYNVTAIQVSAGHRHTCVLTATLTVKCWGAAEFGQVIQWPEGVRRRSRGGPEGAQKGFRGDAVLGRRRVQAGN